MPLNILILDEGSPGHHTQSEGIVDLLRRHDIEIVVEHIRFYYKLRGIFRPLIRSLMQYASSNIQEWLLKRCGYLDHEPIHKPDLIISSGGKSVYASFVLKHRFEAKNIFVGIPDPFPEKWFDLIITPVARNFTVPHVISGLIPNTVTPDSIASAGEEYWGNGKPTCPCWVLLIGGNSKSHRFSQSDWNGLIKGVNSLAEQNGICWLVTTSRRTPTEVETLLEEHLDRRYLFDLVLYNREPRKVLKPFLSVAERVFVSQDSLTMASEALSSGSPVTLLAPETLKVEQGSYFSEIIQMFPTLPGVTRIAMKKLVDYTIPAAQNETESQSVITMDDMAEELIDHINHLRSSRVNR